MGLASRYNDNQEYDENGRWVTACEYMQAIGVLAEVAKLESDDPKVQQLARIASQEICRHEYRTSNAGRCLTNYYCPLCGKSKQIDSGD